ncbi:cob(I)yrinic acid a,c-diamide adenosyltransferase [Clostridium sp. Cult1]|uniref:cob(I)yrinic acid a,c-diamide adenosyltransferase n=1 Tax=Clostridium sp. Cult1 TaxID=2079002 RepID=UPI001F03085B|nr:cob(I)yrinic acid a,c-diamide adenosyltransferase [Clostridium sp. Cult1]MCF6463719.1 cob(I)yrinic acid a,c-diamide adenosyltransferase [Clostridium sp. Cult1]
MDKGYIHVYTGNGKGKTTAALGLALRAICAGKKVFIGQFIKGMEYSELKSVDYLPNLVIEQFGRDCFIYKDPEEEDIRLARIGLDKCKNILKEGDYNIVILDELNIAIYYNLFTIEEAIEAINNKASNVEVIITGRYADERIIQIADLVTEMKEIKHYYNKGVEARKGIEV